MGFRQEVHEVGRQVAVAARSARVARRGQDGPGLGIVASGIGERRERPGRVVDVGLVERHPKDVAVLGEVADRPALDQTLPVRGMQVEAQVLDGRAHRPCPLRIWSTMEDGAPTPAGWPMTRPCAWTNCSNCWRSADGTTLSST